MDEETYLGDGVYASFDGYQFWLKTSAQIPVNIIALEPGVLKALSAYVERVEAMLETAAALNDA